MNNTQLDNPNENQRRRTTKQASKIPFDRWIKLADMDEAAYPVTSRNQVNRLRNRGTYNLPPCSIETGLR